MSNLLNVFETLRRAVAPSSQEHDGLRHEITQSVARWAVRSHQAYCNGA